MNHDELHDSFLDAAGEAGPLRVDLGRLTNGVRRRRLARRAAVGGVSLAVAAAAWVSAVSLTGGSPTGTNAAAPPLSVTSAAAPSSGAKAAQAGQVRHYACGGSIAGPIDAGAAHGGVTVSISGVQRGAGGAPQVRYTLTADRPVHVVDKDPGRPRVLVLKDGKIVAGQDVSSDASHPPVSGKPAHFTTIDPAHPYSGTLAVPEGVPCAGVSWDALWKGGYQVAVVVSDWEFNATAPTPVYTPGHVNADPVLVVTSQLG